MDSGSSVLSALLVLALIICAAAAARWFCAAGRTLPGYWATPTGDLAEIVAGGPGGAALYAVSGSEMFGARPNHPYPVRRSGCRRLRIDFPEAALRGKVALDRRRLLWDGAPAWYRQGV